MPPPWRGRCGGCGGNHFPGIRGRSRWPVRERSPSASASASASPTARQRPDTGRSAAVACLLTARSGATTDGIGRGGGVPRPRRQAPAREAIDRWRRAPRSRREKREPLQRAERRREPGRAEGEGAVRSPGTRAAERHTTAADGTRPPSDHRRDMLPPPERGRCGGNHFRASGAVVSGSLPLAWRPSPALKRGEACRPPGRRGGPGRRVRDDRPRRRPDGPMTGETSRRDRQEGRCGGNHVPVSRHWLRA